MEYWGEDQGEDLASPCPRRMLQAALSLAALRRAQRAEGCAAEATTYGCLLQSPLTPESWVPRPGLDSVVGRAFGNQTASARPGEQLAVEREATGAQAGGSCGSGARGACGNQTASARPEEQLAVEKLRPKVCKAGRAAAAGDGCQQMRSSEDNTWNHAEAHCAARDLHACVSRSGAARRGAWLRGAPGLQTRLSPQ